MKLSIALQVAAAFVLVALAVVTFPSAQPEKLLTVNDRAVWGYDEAGNLVNKPLPPIVIDLK
jgi:hypothetical protein